MKKFNLKISISPIIFSRLKGSAYIKIKIFNLNDEHIQPTKDSTETR